jgi:hypothetical protein
MEKRYARSAQSQLLPWLRALATLVLFTAFSWQAEAQSCCQVNIPSASVQNGCVVLNNPPSGACGDQVEWMWAENVNGSIQGRTGFSTNQSMEWCPDYAGDFRICVRVVGCNQVYESGDTHVNPGECSGGVTAIKIMDSATGQPAAGIPVLGDGVSFSFANLPASYYFEVFTNGNSESAQITVNGVSNTENVIPYNSYASLVPGNNAIVIALYGQDNLGGQQCDHVTINFQAEDDSCVTLTNGSSPYGTNDDCFLTVIENDSYCCTTWWDNVCQDAYDDCQTTGELIETCVLSGYASENGRVVWLPNFATDLRATSSGVFFAKYNDGTAKVYGSVESIANPNNGFEFSIWFNNQSTYNQWISQGGAVKEPQLGDEQNWTFYTLDDSKSSAMTGFGAWNGQVLSVDRQNNNYGLQIGDGANALNSNDNGFSMWFDHSGTNVGHGDINATITCASDPGPNVDQFELECADGLKVSVQGIGIEGQSCGNLTLGNGPGDLEYAILETVWKGNNPPSSVTFVADGVNYTASAQNVIEGNGTNQNNKKAYRVQVPSVTNVSVCVPGGFSNNLRSFVAYEFSSNAGMVSAGSGEFVGRHLWQTSYTMTLPIEASDVPRDIVVTLPLSDMSDDGRNADFDITAGPISKHYVITGNTEGLSLNLTPFILENVPGDVTEVEIFLQSNPANNPSSFIAAGLAIADAQCDTPETEEECEVIGYNGFGQRHFWFQSQFGQDWISDADGLKFIQFADGTAKVSGEIYRMSNSNDRFEVVIYFKDKSDYAQWTGMGMEAKLCGGATLADAQDWTYWNFDQDRPSVLTGRGNLTGEYLFIRPMDNNEQYGLQLGNDGANCKNDEFGFSVWFSYGGTANGHGDINSQLNCPQPVCEIECPSDLTVDCESNIDPSSTGYPTAVCTDNAACIREAGEFDFEMQGWGNGNNGWSLGSGWDVGTGCDPSCGDIPNVFIDFTNFHTDYDTKLKSPMYNACCTDNVYLNFCMQQDLYGGENVPGYMDIQYRINGGAWVTLHTYQNVYGSTINYNDTYEIPGASGEQFEVRFRARGQGSSQFTMGGWGIDNIRVYGQSSGCNGDTSVDINWAYSDVSQGTCPEVITRTFTGEYNGEALSCTQTITLVDEVAPIFTYVPADAAVSCSEDLPNEDATAIDNCGDAIITVADVSSSNDCDDLITRTFTATDNCGNIATAVQLINVIADVPTVSASSTPDNCSQGEGSITLTFEDSACRSAIKLSIDGGANFVQVNDNSGSYTFEGLTGGTYDLFAQWGDNDCPTDLADITVGDNTEIELEINNYGICVVDLYEWLPGGDQFVEELAPGETFFVTTHVGAMWRIVGDNWNPGDFDAQYTVEGCFDQVWNVNPDYCQPECVGNLSVDAGSNQSICEGESVTLTATISGETDCNEIISCYTIGNGTAPAGCFPTPGTGVVFQRAAGCAGLHTIWQAGNDLRLTEFADGTAMIDGTITNNGQVGILHMDLYEKENSGNTWNASCYTNNLGSNKTFYRSFIGTVTVGNEVFTIEEKLSEQHFILADGAGFNTGSYGLGSWTGGTFGGCTEWFATLTPCEIPSQETSIVWSTGETTESITVNAGGTYTVTVTDCAGCVAQDEVTINILENPEVSVSSTNPVCLEENGSITFTFADVASRSNIEFSIDGGNTWPAAYNVADNSASFTIDGLAPGTYELVTRWGNDECPVDLGNITLVADECASLGNFVFYDDDRDGIQDAGEEGVEGVEVELYICGEDTPIASTSTNANGIYVFENLNPANDYYVVFVGSSLPADYVFSAANQGGDDSADSDADQNGQTACVELESGEFNDTVDAGINQPTASLGNFVFYDDDRDGIQDAGEEGVEGVTVQLFVNGGAAPVATTTTNENGFYIFENLEPGVEYFVVFAPASLPADYVFSPANQGGDDALDSDAGVNGQSPIVVLAPGEFNDTIDAGINNPLGSIGDFVWEDEDQDGIQDPNEDGIQGVNVALYICGETDPIASTSTDENGFYNFPNLEPGVEYYVVFETPTGFTGTTANAGASDTNDSDADENGATACYELSPGEDYEDFDAGFFIPTNIGDFVWFDDNQNGIQDAGEEGVNGVEVNLVAAGNDGIFGTADDQVVATETTDVDGMYLFENVLPGDYIIVFNPSTLPADYVLTAQNEGGNDELDSDANPMTGATEPFTVVYGQDDDLSFDAGISTCPVPMLNEEEPVDVNITCEDEVPAAAVLTFSDFIYGAAEVTFTEIMNELECGNEIVRTWTATNECGTTATVDQVITITDDLAPVITFQTPDQTIECDQEIPEIVVTYEDNCDENLTVVVDNWINDLACGFEYVKYCSATDDCGNMSEATVTITVLDTTPPVATNQPENITIECDEEVPAFDPMFTDNCDDTLELSAQSNQSASDCGFQISRSWTAIDDCGNETTVSQIITIVDTTAPVFLTTPEDYVVNCDNGSSDPEFAGEPSVEDNCDINPVLTFVDGVAGQDCPASFERTWTVRDNCGNEEVYVQVITINDFAAPVLVTPGDVTIECDESTDPSNTGMATASDDCSTPNVTYVDGPLSGDCPYTFERTWTAIDACGNTEQGVQVITIEDTQAPVADGEGQELTIECDEEMPQLTMTFHDNCDTNLEVTVTTSVEMEGCNEIFYQTITATDECGNQASVTNVITVVDTTAPVLINVPEDATIDCNDEVPAAIVSAIDNCDNNPLVSMSASTEFLACGYEITRTWTAVDACGNESSESQVLTVIDTEAPVVTAPADYVVNCDNGSSDPEFAGEATATDNCSEFTITFVDGPATDVCPATFERTWTATDACGNAASDVQIITINDFAAPVITCPADITIECTESTDPANTGMATATDDCSVPTVSYVDGPMSGDCPYTFERTWTAVDPCGNADECVQVITIDDTVAPVLSGEDEELTLQCSVQPAIEAPTATDNCDTDVTITPNVETTPGECANERTLVYTWTAMDECGNTAVRTLTINFIDTEAPELIGVPDDTTINCNDELPLVIVSAMDNCDNNPVVSMSASTEFLACGYEITRTWTAVDACGNQSSESQVLTVIDTEAPVVTAPADYVVNCDNGSSDPEFAGEATATDNCSEFTITFVDGPATDVCPATFERTWTATDACGNAASAVQLITINDAAAPFITCPDDVTIECTESTDPANTGMATATDDCSVPTVSYVDGPMSGDCPYTFNRTWIAVDPCGNESTCVQVITIDDTVAPVLSGEDEELTLQCSVQPVIEAPTATDNCDADVTITPNVETTPGECANERTVVYTWTAMDECGNTAVRTLTINFIDTEAPELIGVPEDATINCNDAVPAAIVSAIDNCDNNPLVSMSASTEFLACGYEITRTWTAVDACGNESSESQVLTVIDTEAPVVTPPADYVVSCDNGSSDPEFAGEATATDNCSEFTITFTDGPATDVCPATFERTWKATDACGNFGTAVQIITINDFAAPVITCPADITIECTESTDPANTGMATATDDCSVPMISYVDGPMSGDCPYTFERTWTAVDPCGNEDFCVQIITIEDTVAPVLSGEDEELTLQCNVQPNIIAPTATDNCDTDVTITPSIEVTPGECANERTEVYTWTAMDECGNTAVRTITINFVDTEAPVFVTEVLDMTVECDNIPAVPAVFATDNCGDVVPTLAESSEDLGCETIITRTWTAVDACGNTATKVQVLTVVDTTDPFIVSAPANVTIECDQPEPTEQPEFDDNCDDELEVIAISGINNVTECGYTIERTWTAIDNCGNAVSVSQTITVVDTTAPVLDEAPADITVNCTEIPAAAELQATDNCDEDPTVVLTETLGTGCPYTITRTWTATDACGNTSEEVQVLTVIDEEAPVLVGVPADITEECGDAGTPAEVTATDNCDTDIAVMYSQEVIGTVCPLTIVRTWTATDNCGNTTSASQTIVIDDETAPVFVNGPATEITVECDNVPAPSLGTAFNITDNCDPNPSISFEEAELEGEVLVPGQAPCAYTLIRTWTATDLCGNEATYVQTVNVVDTTAPVLFGVPADITVECTAIPAAAEVSAEDNCFDGNIEVTVSESISPLDCGYELTRTWTAMDNCLNEVSASQTITVQDVTPPVLVSVPADVTVECDEELPAGMATFSDNCDDDIEVAVSLETFTQSCGYYIVRTFTATDDCDNETVATQTITFEDTTAPVFVDFPADESVECSNIPAPASPMAEDNCDENVEISYNEEIISGECPYTIERTWTAIDDCLNETSMTQILTVIDTTAPVLLNVPADATVECDNIPGVEVVEATDNCDQDLIVEFSDEFESADCGYIITRTWTIMDDCGNMDSASQVLTVIDTTPPVANNIPEDFTIECDQQVPFAAPGFSDNCDDQVQVEFNEEIEAGDCESNYTIVRTWTGMDDCGNSEEVVQMITVVDTTAPVFVEVPADATVECDNVPVPAEVAAEDNCSNVIVELTEEITPADCGYTLTRTWTATDVCGNMDEAVQVLTVVDTTPPVAMDVPADITIECDQAEPTDMPSFEDNCDTDLTLSAISGINNVTDCGYEIARVWTAVDDCGNETSVTQIITVVDTTAPVFVEVPADATVECDNVPAPAQVEAEDNCSDVIVELTEEITPADCGYTLTRTWTATDVCGNMNEAVQVLTVVDTTPPVAMDVPADITIECDQAEPTDMPSFEDNCDSDLTLSAISGINNVTDCGYEIARVWTAVDNCGNETSVTQIITVVDTTGPVFVEVPADATVECDNVPAPAEVAAEDNCSNVIVELTEEITPADCGYTLTRTWTATDVCGNMNEAVQVLTVVDTTAPVILNGPADVTVECNEVPGQINLEVEDNCDNLVEVIVTETEEAADCGYVITRTYTATDDCENSTEHVQVITVTDTTPPVLIGVPEDVSIECGEALPASPEVSAEDNCDANPIVSMTEETSDLACGYQVLRIFRAVDECGNESMQMQTITVADTTPPVIEDAPEDITVDCANVTMAATLMATDNCDENVEVILTEEMGEGCPYTITRTWTATDDCNNSSSVTQIITVIDEEAPVWDNFAPFVTVECNDFDSYTLTASDNCDADVTVTIIQDFTVSGGCIPNHILTFQAEDECGNTIIAEQIVQVVDTTDPEIFNIPADLTIACDDEIPAAATDIFGTDNCDADVEIEFTEVQTNDFCPYEIIRTWTAIDNCGNVTEGVQTITVTVDGTQQVNLFSFPNPFNDRFHVEFQVPRGAEVVACVLDMTGRNVLDIHKGQVDAQRLYQFDFAGLDWPAGSYIIMLQVDDEVFHHKLIVTQNN